MRLRLKKGKQRELILVEKGNLSWKEFSEKLGIKRNRLLTYFHEECLIPEELFNKFKNSRKFTKFILEKKEDNWGQAKGGKLSRGKTKEINIPNESKELAEFYGIMLGDGNLTKIKSYKIGTYSARIIGDFYKDKEYLVNYVKPLIEKLFETKVRVSKFRSSNAMFLEIHSKKLVDFLESKGFKSGDKIRNNLNIPNWIKQNSSFLKSCICGLYDTDGCIYKLTNQNSHQISFSNKNTRLLKEARESLISLGIHPSKITKEREFNITKKSELRRFLKLVGFHNSKHLNKVRMFNIAPSYSGQILTTKL